MTRTRTLTLLSGVVVLFALTWWRLGSRKIGEGSSRTPWRQGHEAGSEVPTQARSFGGEVMGTTYSVKCVVEDEEGFKAAEAAVRRALVNVDERMSTYRKDSEVSIFNRLPAHQGFTFSPGVMEVLQLSRDLFFVSSGAFDITVGPLVRAWGFGAGAESTVPSDERLAQLRTMTGFELLTFRPPFSIEKKVDGVEIDLGGIAKGYGVDQAAEALEALGLNNFLVEVGGELRFLGAKPGAGAKSISWTLAIEEPTVGGRRVHGVFLAPTSGGALATSGDYRNFREVKGQFLSHILDPREGHPVARRSASVSVLRPTAAEADGLATALSVLEPDEALTLADEKGWAVYLLEHKEAGAVLGRSSREFAKLSMKKAKQVTEGSTLAP